MSCQNQWDQQSHRLFSVDGVMQTLYGGQNAGGNTVGVMQTVKRRSPLKKEMKNEEQKCHA